MFTDDRDILRLYLFDKQKGFKAIFDKYYKPLCLFAAEIIDEMPLAEDVVQSVFLNCLEKDSISNIRSSLSSYLYVSVKNASLNKLKQKKHEHCVDLSQLETEMQWDTNYSLPDNDLIAATENAVSKLPDRCRAVFNAVVLEKHSYAETASRLGVSVNTVKTQLSRAFTKLKKDLKHYL